MVKKSRNHRDAGIGMIVVAGSLAVIGLLSVAIGEDVLYADKIYRANVAEFEKCWADDDVTSPECQKFKQVRVFQTCLDNLDLQTSECYKYTMQIQSGIIGGALFQMNRLTSNLNKWEDFSNGYS